MQGAARSQASTKEKISLCGPLPPLLFRPLIFTIHAEEIFRTCVRLSFIVKKLQRLSTPTEYIRKFTEACVLPIILYCSSAIFPGLPKHDFALPKRSLKLIRYVCGLSFSYLTNIVCECHIRASPDFAARILGDHQHPLQEDLSKARSYTSTRSCFKLVTSKIATYRNCVTTSG